MGALEDEGRYLLLQNFTSDLWLSKGVLDVAGIQNSSRRPSLPRAVMPMHVSRVLAGQDQRPIVTTRVTCEIFDKSAKKVINFQLTTLSPTD